MLTVSTRLDLGYVGEELSDNYMISIIVMFGSWKEI